MVLSILQDSDGYLWIGTPDGISRFDGLEMEAFGKEDGLGDSVVRTVLETSDGGLWVGTDRGLARRDPGRRAGRAFESLGPDTGLDAPSVRALAEGEEGTLWIGTYSGLYRLRRDLGDTFEVDRWGPEHGLPHERVRSVLVARDGRVWIGTYGGGAAVFDGDVFRSVGEEAGLDPVVRDLLELPDGTILAGTNRGVFRIAASPEGPMAVERLAGADAITSNATSLLLDRLGRLWIGTRGRGACRLPGPYAPDETLECLRLPQGLADESVNCLHEDREGNLWIGTFGGGVSRLTTEAFRSYGAEEGLPHPSVRAIGERRDGSLWVGTHGGGLARLDGERFVAAAGDRVPVRDALGTVPAAPSEKVISSGLDAEGRLWFGTLGGVLEPGADGYRPFAPTPEVGETVAGAVVLALAEDADGTLWLGTIDGLLAVRDGRVEVYSEDAGLPDPRINDVLIHPAGGLWLATAGGLARFAGGRVIEVLGEDDGLGDPYVGQLLLRSDGSLWAATAGGLSVIEQRPAAEDAGPAWEIRTFTAEDGLSHDKCTALVEAEDGNLWIGTTQGINIYDGTAFMVFGADDGLVSGEVSSGAAFRSRDGRLWFGTVRGLVVFDPRADLRRVPPPPVHLRRVEVEDVEVTRLERDEPLELRHRRDDLAFEFVGLSLAFPESVRYQYRLHGLDGGWRETSARRAEYHSIPPGEYVFEVLARGRGGVPSPRPARFALVIRPPFWATWWFRLGAAAAILGLAVGLHLYRLRLLEARNRELTRQIRGRREAEAELRRYAEELEHTSLHDSLTGLPNRAVFQDRLQVSIDRARRHAEEGESDPEDRFAVFWIDLDDFKLINDSRGHDFGDRLLGFCARRLEQEVGESGTLARLSGDEFAVLRPAVDGPAEARRIADRLQSAFGRPFEVEDVEVVLTASIGITMMNAGYRRAGEMLRDADNAVYRAKARGRGGTALFDPVMHNRAVSTLELESQLRHALEREEFELHYQPILALRHERIAGFEALLRWNHPERGLLAPGEFLHRLVATGLHIPLGEWIVLEACRCSAVWSERTTGDAPAPTVAINLFHRQVSQDHLPDDLEEILETLALPPRGIQLEITEDVLIDEPEAAIDMLHRVKSLDVRVCLDDFGTGFSSMSYLHRFPVDVLKIDRSFVGRMERDEDSRRIVESILYLARSLGIEVVAEGVETAEQLRLLHQLDCDYAQGFHVGRPVPVREAEALLFADADAGVERSE